MDAGLPLPRPLDRRTLARLVFAGTSGTAFAEAGGPVTVLEGFTTLDSLQRMTATLAGAYDTVGPLKIVSLAPQLEKVAARILTDRSLSTTRRTDATAAYARLLTLSANATTDVGDHRMAVRSAEMAASLAVEAGDGPTAGHAWSVVASALCNAGKGNAALSTARRARSVAGSSPAGVMSLLEEASAAASMGHTHAVVDAVTAAEKAHAALAPDQWGGPGYSFGTYHPGNVKAHAGAALARVGLYRDAAARLAEAADILADADGLEQTYVRLLQARVALGAGDVSEALGLATVAVTQAEARPAAWVARIVGELDRASQGSFAALVTQTTRWGFAAA